MSASSRAASSKAPISLLVSPAQHQRIEPSRDFEQSLTRGRVHCRQWMTYRVGANHAAFLHQRLARCEAALAVLVVDQRQPLLIVSGGSFGVACSIGVDDQPNTVGIAAARHRTGCACVELGPQRGCFLTV